MKSLTPVTLEGHGVRLEPLHIDHETVLRAAVADGRLWELWFASVPAPDELARYIEDALASQRAGRALPFLVCDAQGTAVGCTRLHDCERHIDRVHIGYTWYSASRQRTHVNTACKLLLLTHAFETLSAQVVVLRTDRFNLASQRAIAALGAKLDGVLRHHQARRDGTVRDSVIFSILRDDWTDVRRHLLTRLARHDNPAST